MLLLMQFDSEREDDSVNVVGVFDDVEKASAYIQQLVNPRTNYPMYSRHEQWTNDHYWYCDAGDYIVGINVERNPEPLPLRQYDWGLLTPKNWAWHTPVFELGESEDDEDEQE